jgi:hypothetical protein
LGLLFPIYGEIKKNKAPTSINDVGVILLYHDINHVYQHKLSVDSPGKIQENTIIIIIPMMSLLDPNVRLYRML